MNWEKTCPRKDDVGMARGDGGEGLLASLLEWNDKGIIELARHECLGHPSPPLKGRGTRRSEHTLPFGTKCGTRLWAWRTKCGGRCRL